MLAAGVDLVPVKRIEESVSRYGARFLSRVFTEGELAYCRGRPQELAARFAAKEAVSKTLGVGIHHREGVQWHDIEVVSDANGKPSVRLGGNAARRAGELGFGTFALSLSHTREYAIAMVVAE